MSIGTKGHRENEKKSVALLTVLKAIYIQEYSCLSWFSFSIGVKGQFPVHPSEERTASKFSFFQASSPESPTTSEIPESCSWVQFLEARVLHLNRKRITEYVADLCVGFTYSSCFWENWAVLLLFVDIYRSLLLRPIHSALPSYYTLRNMRNC